MSTEQTENAKERDKLDHLLENNETKGWQIAELGRHLTKVGQKYADMAHTTREILQMAPDSTDFRSLTEPWAAAGSYADLVLGQTGTVDIPAFSTSGGTAFAASWQIFEAAGVLPFVSSQPYTIMDSIHMRFQEIANEYTDQDETATIMKSLGLEKATRGQESALALFRAAYDVYEKPSAENIPASTSLLPMRESIDATIAYLLRHCPTQSKTGNNEKKILRIGIQLKRASIANGTVAAWAQQWPPLKKELSETKQRTLTRAEWQTLLIKSTLFLKNLLEGIDPSKLRK
ncbi:MAG: hypothetical protein A2Y73_06965 [Chloroflexi bacterium RBG_13_56_8]|nr:MAG: hypothetical protein A2Y73_06965 [Chloroflexi bacterium RBG_13_56_8]